VLTAPDLSPILDDAELAYVGVETASGTMVTPLLFAVRDGRIWMVMPRSSAKVTAIERNRTIGLAAGTPEGMAVLQGDAHLVDPMRPQSLVTSLPETLLSPRALASYVTGNLDHLAGLIGPGALSPRTAAALRPQRAVVVRPGRELWSAGDWADGASPYDGEAAPQPLPVDAAPGELRELTEQAGPVLVGWATAAGPVVLPGTWDPDRRRATVRSDLFHATGCLPQARGCVLFDGTEGTKLEGKTGIAVRGRGTAHVADGGDADVTMRVERLSWWVGDDARTVKAG
jgi:hypothetical protein